MKYLRVIAPGTEAKALTRGFLADSRYASGWTRDPDEVWQPADWAPLPDWSKRSLTRPRRPAGAGGTRACAREPRATVRSSDRQERPHRGISG